MKTIYNCHTHVFTNKAVPSRFLYNCGIPVLGWFTGMTKLLFKTKFAKKLGNFMHKLDGGNSNDIFDRYAAFVNIGNNRTSEDIFKLMKGYYPKGTVFVIYSMDMEYMGAGKPRQKYREQLEELAVLKNRYPDLIKAFIMLDPRRGKQEIEDLAKEFIEKRGFTGIKVYPLLGYFPDDDRLSGVYEYAQKNNIPVAGHCAGGVVFYRKRLKPYPVGPDGKPVEFKHQCYHFSHPLAFEKVAEKYPRMKLNLAHAGGREEMDKYMGSSWDISGKKDENWFVLVKRIMRKHKNVYTDISSGFQLSRFMPVLKLAMLDGSISGRILYGSDYYMEQVDMTEREFSVECRAALGEKDFFKIAHDNAKKFLG